jgi:hypothetical protein
MSDPFIPPAFWEEGDTQARLSVNDTFLRWWITQANVNNATTAQPGSPADGDTYIIQSTHTGAQWATFDPEDLAIYFGGTWYAFAPVEGNRVSVSGAVYIYTSGAWTASGGGGGGSDRSGLTAVTSTSGVVNLNCSLGDYFTITLTENISSLTFSNLPASGHAQSIMLRITQDSTPRTFAWPASFRWAGGVVPAISTGSGAIDVLAMTTFNQGTTHNATLSKAWA